MLWLCMVSELHGGMQSWNLLKKMDGVSKMNEIALRNSVIDYIWIGRRHQCENNDLNIGMWKYRNIMRHCGHIEI